MRNRHELGNALLQRAVGVLGERLPARWAVIPVAKQARRTAYRPDAVLDVRAPDGSRARVIVEAKASVTAAEAAALVTRLEQAARENNAAGRLVVANYLSPLARERLSAGGVSYLDFTGNARITLDRPAVLIESKGADRDPAPERRDARSLKGGSAARIVRALADWRPPVGVRELARRAEVDPGYATRILTLLTREDVISRDARGEVTTVNWRDLLRRWAQDYAVTRTNRAVPYLEPRSLDSLFTRLSKYEARWAASGSRAIPRAALVAPTRMATVYVESPELAAAQLELRRVDAGANVLLLEPFDSVVWQRMRQEDGLKSVAVSQCAVDLLTGTGREPSEAEGLFAWMERNERAWRR